MKTITKTFDTLDQAEAYLDELYDEYDHVRVVKTPLFSEGGVYIYEVK